MLGPHSIAPGDGLGRLGVTKVTVRGGGHKGVFADALAKYSTSTSETIWTKLVHRYVVVSRYIKRYMDEVSLVYELHQPYPFVQFYDEKHTAVCTFLTNVLAPGAVTRLAVRRGVAVRGVAWRRGAVWRSGVACSSRSQDPGIRYNPCRNLYFAATPFDTTQSLSAALR